MKSVTRPEGCLSDLALDELHAGELEPSARERAEAHLGGCARCRERRAVLARVHDEVLAAVPDFASLTSGAPAVRAAPRRSRAFAAAGAALAVAAAVLLMVRPQVDERGDRTRSKGAPHLGLIVKRGEQVTPGESGARVRAGDLVRFTYSSERERHLAVLALDSQRAQLYFPTQAEAGGRALRSRAGSNVALDFSVELDATPGDEQVFGLFCDDPIELEPVRAALERQRARPEVPGCTVDRLVLHKEPAR